MKKVKSLGILLLFVAILGWFAVVRPQISAFSEQALAVKIKVEEDLFGKYDKKYITIRVPGGETRTQKTIHELSPQFVKGERVIVFVGKGDSYSISENNYTVVGLHQGTMRLIDDLDNGSDSSRSSVSSSEKQVISKFATDNMSEDSMKNIIKSLKNKD